MKLMSECVTTVCTALLTLRCPDLLRRLSKSQNTVFCGRIQLFLARLFPLEEKSGTDLHHMTLVLLLYGIYLLCVVYKDRVELSKVLLYHTRMSVKVTEDFFYSSKIHFCSKM